MTALLFLPHFRFTQLLGSGGMYTIEVLILSYCFPLSDPSERM